ncbi:family 43 glycosylhydrolase [Streptomyces sp. NPDC008343]|uniref:family 43 glycosylhydrolase n=1 Tax=Streptomyces sp. NPDC008343 TaxID=3364828 RepID=UPI0036ED5B25
MKSRLRTKLFTAVAAIIAALAAVGSSLPAQAATSSPVIANDTVWKDTAGNPIHAQGGNVLKVGSTYYWVGVELTRGIPNDPKKINLYRSTNLETWTFEATILEQSANATGDLEAGQWLGRPQLLHNAKNNNYVLVVEVSGALGNNILFATSSRIKGPYTPTGPSTEVNGATMGDHSVFVEGNQAYLVYVADSDTVRNQYMAVAPLDADFTKVEPWISQVFDNLHEAPGIVKIGSKYYNFASGKNWWDATATAYRTSTDLRNWSAWATVPTSPASTHSFGTQFEQIIPVRGSRGTSYLYSGDRYSQFYGGPVPAPGGIGRNAWYRLTFDSNGVPTLHGDTDIDVDAAAGTLKPNRVANGRFDQDVAGVRPPQWTVTGTSGAAYVQDTTDPTNRELTFYDDADFDAWVGQDVSLPNGTYHLSFQYKSSGGMTNASFGIKNHGAPESQTDLNTAQGSWATKTVRFTVTTGKVTLGIWAQGAAKKWLNIDNVALWPAC